MSIKNKPRKVYLTNKEILRAIHESKMTFCSYVDPVYRAYDHIVDDVSKITPKLIEEVRAKKAKPRGKKEEHVDPLSIPVDTLVFRVMTYEHIPLATEARPKRGKNAVAHQHEKCCFPPFKHYIVKDGSPVEVLRSHWEGGFDNGWFAPEKGRASDELGLMYITLCTRYARRPNFRGYSYVEEMIGLGLQQLSQVGLQFDESKSDNPFAFYTTTVRNCFVKILQNEKKQQEIRDDLLVAAGASPSSTRQFKDEMAAKLR
jgi:hypothetical protein